MSFLDVDKVKKELNKVDELDLGKAIKQLRVKCELTQKELADLLNLSKETICKIEQGKRNLTLDNYVKLSILAKMIKDSEFLGLIGMHCSTCKLKFMNDKYKPETNYQNYTTQMKKWDSMELIGEIKKKNYRLEREIEKLQKELEKEKKAHKQTEESLRQANETNRKYWHIIKEKENN